MSSVDEYSKKVKENGGTIVVPKHAVPGVGWLVYFTDTEETMFWMMEGDESAQQLGICASAESELGETVGRTNEKTCI